MDIASNKVLMLYLVVLICLSSGGAQISSKNAAHAAPLNVASAKTSTPSKVTNASNANDPNEFVIGSEDVLAINVWQEPEVSRAVAVRSDGKISLPLLGDIEATGKTPKQLQAEIAKGLVSYISDPEVTVIVQAANSRKYSIIGRIGHAGTFPLSAPMTVLEAIVAAGGFQNFAKLKKIYILRMGPDGHQQKIPFNYVQVIQGKNTEQNVPLQARDIIVVP